MNTDINKKNIYENYPGPASDYKSREFLQWEKSELVENMDKNKVQEEFEQSRLTHAERLARIKKRKETDEKFKKRFEINYNKKREIIDNKDTDLREIQKNEELQQEEKEMESISSDVNISLFYEEFSKIFEFYKEKKIDDKYLENIRTRVCDAIVNKEKKITNKHLWKSIKMARGLTFLLSTETEWKYVRLETQKNKNFEIYENKNNPWEYKVIEYFRKERKEKK